MKSTALGERIKELRVKKQITLRGLALSADVSPSFLCEIEACRSYPSEAVLERIAGELGVSAAGLRKLDRRSDLADHKALLQSDPAWGSAFKVLGEAGLSGRLTPDHLIKKIGDQ